MKSTSQFSAGHYDANYGNFELDLYAEIRLEAFGEDIGQNSWITSGEQDKFLKWLDLSTEKTLLDIGCGAGGPPLRIASITGCSVVGVDVHEQAVATAISLASRRSLAERADFRSADANQPLPFPDASFDAVTSVDAFNHLIDRPRVIAEWTRLLKPGGRLLITDPIILTGPMTNSEIAARRLVCEDVTSNMIHVAEARRAARASRSSVLRAIEGDQAFEVQQEFLAVAARVARRGSLSRFVYVATKLS